MLAPNANRRTGDAAARDADDLCGSVAPTNSPGNPLAQGAIGAEPNLGCADQPKSEQEHDKSCVLLGQEAWRRLTSCQSWSDRLLVGEALLIGRTECMRVAHTNRPEGRRYNEEFSDWLKANKFDGIDKGTRSRLLECLVNIGAIEKWRNALPTSERLKLNFPTAVLRRWKKTQVKKPDNAKPKPSAMAKLKATIIDLEEQNHRLVCDSKHNAPFTPRDKPIDIAGYVWRTIHQDPKAARSIARALDRIAKEAEQADTTEVGDDDAQADRGANDQLVWETEFDFFAARTPKGSYIVVLSRLSPAQLVSDADPERTYTVEYCGQRKKPRIISDGIKSADEAKAIAQADYDRRCGR